VKPEQSFVPWNAFVPRDWFREDAAETENTRAPSKTTPVAIPSTLCGNPARPGMEASSAPEASVTDVCAARCLFAAELDLFVMSGFNIFPRLLGVPCWIRR
jgi:hypothetical protein